MPVILGVNVVFCAVHFWVHVYIEKENMLTLQDEQRLQQCRWSAEIIMGGFGNIHKLI